MRTSGRTKRELAITAALLGQCGAQVRCEAEHPAITEQEAEELEAIGRRLMEISESLFDQSQPGVGRTVFDLEVAKRLEAATP